MTTTEPVRRHASEAFAAMVQRDADAGVDVFAFDDHRCHGHVQAEPAATIAPPDWSNEP